MFGFLKYLVAIVVCVAIASFVSYIAFHGFWYGARLFHSVPAARACDAIGGIVLLPVRIMTWCFGGAMDQSVPLSNPWSYCINNGVFLGILAYAAIRRFLFGIAKSENGN